MKHLVLAAFLTCSAATAYAQPQQATSPPAPGTTTIILPGHDMPAPTVSADTRKLIGRNRRERPERDDRGNQVGL